MDGKGGVRFGHVIHQFRPHRGGKNRGNWSDKSNIYLELGWDTACLREIARASLDWRFVACSEIEGWHRFPILWPQLSAGNLWCQIEERTRIFVSKWAKEMKDCCQIAFLWRLFKSAPELGPINFPVGNFSPNLWKEARPNFDTSKSTSMLIFHPNPNWSIGRKKFDISKRFLEK